MSTPKENGAEGLHYFSETISWSHPLNSPRLRGTKDWGKEVSVDSEIIIHPSSTGRIIVNYPGYNGNIDGYNGKYRRLAVHMQDRQLGAVIRSANNLMQYFSVDAQLRQTLAYAQRNDEKISGSDSPEVFLMGFSAGASAIAAIAHEYPEVTRILLMAPSFDAREAVRNINHFTGELYVVVGENDEVVGKESAERIFSMAENASHKELFVLPDCDHQFRGEANGRIISQSPFYAFAKGIKPNFPTQFGGLKLY